MPDHVGAFDVKPIKQTGEIVDEDIYEMGQRCHAGGAVTLKSYVTTQWGVSQCRHDVVPRTGIERVSCISTIGGP